MYRPTDLKQIFDMQLKAAQWAYAPERQLLADQELVKAEGSMFEQTQNSLKIYKIDGRGSVTPLHTIDIDSRDDHFSLDDAGEWLSIHGESRESRIYHTRDPQPFFSLYGVECVENDDKLYAFRTTEQEAFVFDSS